MLISFFDFGTNHTKGPKSQAGRLYYKAKGQGYKVPERPGKAEKGQLSLEYYPSKMFKALCTLIISGHILRQCLCDFLQGLEKCPMEDKISREHKHSSTKCLPTRTPRLLSVVLKETSGQRLMGNMTSKRLPRRKDTDSGIMFR